MTGISPELLDKLTDSIYQHITGQTGGTGHINDFGSEKLTRESLKERITSLLSDEKTQYIVNTSTNPDRGGSIVFFNEEQKTFLIFNPNQLDNPRFYESGHMISGAKGPDNFAGTFFREPKLNSENIPVSSNSGRPLKEKEVRDNFKEAVKSQKNQIAKQLAAEGHNVTGKDIEPKSVKDPNADWADRIKAHETKIGKSLETGKARLANNGWSEAIKQEKIDAVLEKGELTSIAADKEGNVVHIIDEKTNSIVTIDKTSGQRTLQQFENADAAREGFGKLIKDAANTTGEMPKLIKGGIEAVQDAIKASSSLFGKIAHLGGETAKFLGKAAKVLGPLGVIGATAEAAAMEGHLQDALKYKMIPPEAATAYRALIGSQLAQATVDPTMVGGEAVIQIAFEEWCNTYGVTGELKEQLEPGSLIEDITGKEIGGKSKPAKPLPEGVKQYSLMGDTGFEESDIVAQQNGPKGGAAPNTRDTGQPSVQRAATTPYYEVAMMP